MDGRLTSKTLVITAVAILAACSNVDDDERIIYVKPAEAVRGVLIEDFTGQNCLNCPYATEEIEAITEQYGDNVVAVGIHSGPLGFAGNDKYVGLMTDMGNTYYNYWSIDAQPKGVINRSSGPLDYPLWSAYVHDELEKSTPINLSLANTYDPETRNLYIETQALSIEGDADGKLQLWIVEDSIVAYQKMPTGKYDYGYVHNHVFRDAVNGEWGEDISLKEEYVQTLGHTYSLPEGYVAENVSVVAFIYDGSGVRQVVKENITSTEQQQ